MRYKPEAFLYEEGHGAFTRGARTKEEAQKLIEELVIQEMSEWDEHGLSAYFEKIEDVKISVERIKEDRMYLAHKKCGGSYWTVGENSCEECGNPTSGKGTRTFTYEF